MARKGSCTPSYFTQEGAELPYGMAIANIHLGRGVSVTMWKSSNCGVRKRVGNVLKSIFPLSIAHVLL